LNGDGGVNPNAQIGSVTVRGDWIASSIVAGVNDGGDGFGNANDVKVGGTDTAVVSKIGSIVIGGQALGTVGGTDHYGFVAQEIGSFKVGATTVILVPLTNNDVHELGATRDLTIREISL